jgi:carbamoyltransferase
MAEYRLGLSAYYHDSAAAIVRGGEPVAAAQEERFSRRRHDARFPAQAVRYCLAQAGITLDDLASVTYYESPSLKFRRILSSFGSAGPRGLAAFSAIAPGWIGEKRKVLDRVDAELDGLGLGRAPRCGAGLHHRSHAASAFYPSPFERAAVLCVDGVGEWHTTSIWRGGPDGLELVNSISFPHSLGLLYSAFTQFCGFKVDSGEYKLMGLAPYGEPIHADLIRDELIHLREDGSFTLNLDRFEFLRGERMVGRAFERLFGRPERRPESALTQAECDLAASIQAVTDEAVLGLARAARRMTGERDLCMAGGVALNCVANGHVARAGIFDRLWIQPAAGDAGCALGVALDADMAASRGRGRRPTNGRDRMNGALLGPAFDEAEIARFLEDGGHAFRRLTEAEMIDEVAGHLAEGRVIGWFQDRMEFGPRALGARSIIGDPRSPSMQRTMNLKIKFRESFRPFAPSVLEEDASDYFELTQESPYMLLVAPVAERIRAAGPAARGLGSINDVRSALPAVTHVDLSARVQTVTEDHNRIYAALLRRFKARTGCAVLVNTSFNVRGEPIVRSPEEAYTCFMRTEIDVLVLGNCVLLKDEQRPRAADDAWREEIPLD